jgi:hypothetical protein
MTIPSGLTMSKYTSASAVYLMHWYNVKWDGRIVLIVARTTPLTDEEETRVFLSVVQHDPTLPVQLKLNYYSRKESIAA